ncbi:MAG: hypothetical protein ACLQLC_08930 [Candidatus Sulfotelmatobacter sp.]
MTPANPGFYQTGSLEKDVAWGYYSATTFAKDQYAQLDCSHMTQSSRHGCGVVVRANWSGNGYACEWSNNYADGHSELYIGKYTDWVYNRGDLVGNYTWNKAPGVIYCSAIGSTITMQNNGTVVLTVTDSTYRSGRPGMFVNSGADELAVDWSGGNTDSGTH